LSSISIQIVTSLPAINGRALGVSLRRVTSWPYNDRPAGFSLPDYGLSPEEREALTDRIWLSLVKGDDDIDYFVECYLEDLDDEETPLTEKQVSQAFKLALETRRSQQAKWTSEETVTNLDRAFDDLEEAGILARQNFTCCGTCGAAEIGGERDESREWRAYVFFHMQDTDRLIQTGSLYLAYGIFPPQDADDLPGFVTAEILPRLARHGLRAEWDGDPRTRIHVHNARWYIDL